MIDKTKVPTLEEMAALEQAATQGPWTVKRIAYGDSDVGEPPCRFAEDDESADEAMLVAGGAQIAFEPDGHATVVRFAAAARAWVPWALARIKELEAGYVKSELDRSIEVIIGGKIRLFKENIVLKSRIDELERDLVEAAMFSQHCQERALSWKADAAETFQRVLELEAENEKLRDTLGWYAGGCPEGNAAGDGEAMAYRFDEGKRARAVLVADISDDLGLEGRA